MAYYELEPWGTQPADQRAELVAWAAMFKRVKTHQGELTLGDVRIQRGSDPAPPQAEGTDEAALEGFFQGIERRQQRRRR